MDEIENKINDLKIKLVQIAETKGINSHETLCCSQELDRYIVMYQKRQFKNNKTSLHSNEVLGKEQVVYKPYG
ncbi:aspartyl-phosphate phosphatase Spo0E family protein [Niallia sp. Krafla_26]|uniref:aspartyl-phosphate phosphatase Spo0E family protein n=1 Tax=Niallia sp. Krafla_26 TaxID=3064703 RepID=UPI003D17660E